MSFLRPLLLFGLPLAALPILIHLINQRRYQTVRWAAMMFLLAANRMSRGYARIRQWLILAARVAAIAALIVAIGRPLAGGWLGGAAGGKADTTIVLLDRSPSMQQSSAGGGGSKFETGMRQLVGALKTLGSDRWVVIEAGSNKPRELEAIDALPSSTVAGPTSAPSDIPAMLAVARDYIKANSTGRTEVWVCSDLREDDWNADGGRWQELRESFLGFTQGVRFHLLAYPQAAPENLSVRVTDVRRQKAGDAAELVVSLRLTREGGDKASTRESVPVQIEVEGARSLVTVEMTGSRVELKDHRIPIEKGRERGWGRVSIPADANPADNDYYFAFDQPAPRLALVVADDPQAARPLQLAASIAPDPSVRCSAEVVAPDQLGPVEWDRVAVLLWEGPLPEGDAAKKVKAFVDRGGQALFFPPRAPSDAEFLGVRWKGWAEPKEEVAVETWRGDQDFLANTQSGAPLPVGQVAARKYCGLAGEFTPLATLKGGAPLLARVATTLGGVYFVATTAAMTDSNLATGGVVLYVLVQRAEAAGASALAGTRQLDAGGPTGDDPARWRRLAGAVEAISTDYPLQRGIYTAGDRLLAVNRPLAEDAAPVLADAKVAELFRGLDFARVDDRAGSLGALIEEVWRPFLTLMMAAMVAEAALCLPKPRPIRPVAGALG